MVMCCVIPWCNKKVSKNLNGSMSNLCIAHNSMCTGMLRFQVRMKMYHKLYKWEKLFNGEELICSKCGRNARLEYPELPGSRYMMLLDVDHINAKKNFNENEEHLYEHPDNYQLLCKSCHGAKSILEKDYLNKKYDNLKDEESEKMLDQPLTILFERYLTRRDKINKL